ncbi:MAG: hypothetical protein WCD79_20405 [Chthoniobacteraceae bacterium]
MWNKIEYRDFCDVPRVFGIIHNQKVYLFDCKFDEDIDDYPEVYKVYRFDEFDFKAKDWEQQIAGNPIFLGEIGVADVKFDSTRRKEVNMDLFERLLQ